MRLPPWEPIAVLACGLALAGVSTWWGFTVLDAPTVPIPGYKGEPFTPLSAAMPPIGGFDSFYVNDDNPFVPWLEREAERKRIQDKPTAPHAAQPPTIITPIDAPILRLPPKKGGGGDAPKVVGFTRPSGGAADVLFLLPGESNSRQMQPGQKAGRWTFVAIEAGNIAVFADETGRQYRLIIGGK